MELEPPVLLTRTCTIHPMWGMESWPYRLEDAVGIIPFFITNDTESMIEQFRDGYGYWENMDGFVMDDDFRLTYKPGTPDADPPMKPLAAIKPYASSHGEIAIVYQSGWVAVYNTNTKTFQVSRMD